MAHGERLSELKLGQLVFDGSSPAVAIKGKAAKFTKRELPRLEIFLGRPTVALTKGQMLDQLFGHTEPFENSIDVLIVRLRRKLTGAGFEVITRWGVGYRIVKT